MAQTPRERRAAQRVLARQVRANRAVPRDQRTQFINANVQQSIWNARVNWASDVMSGREPMPAQGTAEAKNLASLASYASRGRADPRFEAAFSQYWYHFKDAQTPADYEEMPPEDGEDEDSSSEE